MNELYKINLEDKINLLEDSINCNYDLTKMERKTIKELLQEQDKEIERLNKDLETSIEICNNRQKEIVRLNNIINELEKYLIEYSQDLEFRCYANAFLVKLQELKGSDKE